MRFAIFAALGALALASCSSEPAPEPLPEPGPLAVYGNIRTFEIAPVLLAADKYYPGEATVAQGSIANLVGAIGLGTAATDGEADVATNAETQVLRLSIEHPNLRIIMLVADGNYRIVARRSAGIESLADLKGKRIATVPPTSAGFFTHRMLEEAGLTFDDIVAVPVSPLSAMTEALVNKEVDAVAIWEPVSENAAQALGDDLIEFSGEGVYRELFNLNSTAEKLADPVMRNSIVQFLRAVLDATEEIKTNPEAAQDLVRVTGEFDAQDVKDSWEHQGWTAGMPDDLLDVLEAEEKWLAKQDDRPARSREELSKLIDRSVYDEAVALGARE